MPTDPTQTNGPARYTLRPATAADAAAIAHLTWQAFKLPGDDSGATNPWVFQHLSKGMGTPEGQALLANQIHDEIASPRSRDNHRLVAVDKQSQGKVVGTARWFKIYPNDYQSLPLRKLNDDVLLRYCEEIMYRSTRRQWLFMREQGRGPAWTLSSLGVLPEYQGQGIGGQLIRWGVDRADEQGLACCVAVNERPSARRQYLKCGFTEHALVSCADELDPEGKEWDEELMSAARAMGWPSDVYAWMTREPTSMKREPGDHMVP